MIIFILTAVSYCQLRFMNNNDKFDVTENRIISGRLIWFHPKRQICFLCSALHIYIFLWCSLLMKNPWCQHSTDAVYWCIANFPICYSLNIRYTHTHNEYRAAKHKQNNPLSTSYHHTFSSTHLLLLFTIVQFGYQFWLKNGNTERKFQLLAGVSGSLANLGFRNHRFDVINKNSEEKVSNPTKVSLITLSHYKLLAGLKNKYLQQTLLSFVFIKKCFSW